MSQGFQEGDRVRLEGTIIGFGSGGVVQVSGGAQPHHHLWLASPDEVTLVERAEPYFVGQVITKDMRRPLPGTTVVWIAIDGKHSHTITETTRWPFPGEDGVPVRIVDLPHMPTDLSALVYNYAPLIDKNKAHYMSIPEEFVHPWPDHA